MVVYQEEMDTKPFFFVCIKAFYSATVLFRNFLRNFHLVTRFYKIWVPRPGLFWWEVGKITTLLGELRLANLAKPMAGLLAIPASNADSECGFSILRKIHTDQRSNLDQSVLS